MANFAKIKKFNVSNGIGIRTAVFFTGCDFGCEGCFNKDLWDHDTGYPFTDETEEQIFDTINKHISGISILGGEPLNINNVSAVTKLCKDFKERFPDKDIWLWTGNVFSDVSHLEVMQYIDVLVDGRFILKMKEPNLKWKGSANQRVIDVPASMKSGDVVLKEV